MHGAIKPAYAPCSQRIRFGQSGGHSHQPTACGVDLKLSHSWSFTVTNYELWCMVRKDKTCHERRLPEDGDGPE